MVAAASEATPLLPRKPANPPSSPQWRDVLICALAYSTASLFVFTPLRKTLGNSSNKHIVATTAVWFHPVRTLGNLAEVIYFTILLLSFAICVSVAITGLVQFLYTHNLPLWLNSCVLLLFLGSALGLVGFMKVRANKPSFNTASSAAIMFLVTTLLKDDDAERGAASFDRVLNYLKMVALGATISSTYSALLYRRSSLTVIRSKAEDLMDHYADLLDLLVYQFCHGTEDKQVADDCESINNETNALLSTLKTNLQYAKYEFALFSWTPRSTARFKLLRTILWSLQRQSLHLGGLLHCVGVSNQLLKQSNDPSPRPAARRLSSRWDSIGRSGIKAKLSSSGDAARLSAFHRTFNRLTPPVSSFAHQLTAFYRDTENTAETVTATHISLSNYTHARDEALRNNGDQTPTKTTPAEDGLLATCSLFAHILQDLGEEVISTEGLRLKYDDAENILLDAQLPQAASEKDASFSQLTEALYPTRRASHPGLGPALWKLLRLFRNLDVQHGVRCGVGAIILALPAFTPDYRDAFTLWHGEWALITYMIIMARNLGSMTHNIPLRIMGTSIGAVCGIAASMACGENEYLLILSAFLVAMVCFRRILSNHDPVLGRFILLTFNLVCLYGYSMSQNDRDEDDPAGLEPIYDIAFHRVVSVVSGVLWAVFMLLAFWPHSARRALRSDLCIQWMRMGMTWKRDPIGVEKRDENTAPRFRGIDNERELQDMMLDLEALLQTAPNEFRLRGRFDPEPYKHMLEATQVILDAFHSISILIKDEPYATPRELELVRATSPERQELCNLLFLQFYTASASVRLGFPVPEYLPDSKAAIDRLVKKLKDRRHVLVNEIAPNSSSTESGDEIDPLVSNENYDFVLFHSYLMTTITISRELEQIHHALRLLFGTLDDDLLFSYV